MWSRESYTCRESIRIFKSSELREKCLDPVLANRCCVAGRGRDEHRRIRFPETIAPIHGDSTACANQPGSFALRLSESLSFLVQFVFVGWFLLRFLVSCWVFFTWGLRRLACCVWIQEASQEAIRDLFCPTVQGFRRTHQHIRGRHSELEVINSLVIIDPVRLKVS